MGLSEADDLELVEAAKNGDRRAFRVLMQRYQRKVYAVAFGFVRNREDALDVVQEAFVKVHRYLDRFEGNSSFYTWLYRIVANLCIDHLRKTKRHKDVEFDDALRHDGKEDGTAKTGDSLLRQIGDPADALSRKEILAAVHECIGELSDKHRSVIVMRELQGMSYEEMAQAMDCSKGTIMSRLFHARKNMQRMLKERLPHSVPVARPDDAPSSEGRSQSQSKPDPEQKPSTPEPVLS